MKLALKQGTTPWHEWRKGGIGGSESPVVMGCSPYMKRRELFLIKTGRQETKNIGEFIAKRGHRLELVAREYLESLVGEPYPPTCYQSDDHSFIRASLDGSDFEGTVTFEAKHVGKSLFEDIEKRGVDAVPEHHYWQIVQGFVASGATLCYYVVVTADKRCAHVIVKREEADCNRLITELTRFWEMIEAGEEPAPEKHEMRNMTGDNEVTALFHDYFSLKDAIEALEAQQDDVRIALESMAGEGGMFVTDLGRIKPQQRKGSIKWKQWAIDNGLAEPESDDYRNKSSKFYKVDRLKGE